MLSSTVLPTAVPPTANMGLHLPPAPAASLRNLGYKKKIESAYTLPPAPAPSFRNIGFGKPVKMHLLVPPARPSSQSPIFWIGKILELRLLVTPTRSSS